MKSGTWLLMLSGAAGSDNVCDDLGRDVLCGKRVSNQYSQGSDDIGERERERHTTGTHLTDTEPNEVGIFPRALDVATRDGSHSCLFHMPFAVVGPPIWPTRWILVGIPHFVDAVAQILSDTCFDSPYP